MWKYLGMTSFAHSLGLCIRNLKCKTSVGKKGGDESDDDVAWHEMQEMNHVTYDFPWANQEAMAEPPGCCSSSVSICRSLRGKVDDRPLGLRFFMASSSAGMGGMLASKHSVSGSDCVLCWPAATMGAAAAVWFCEGMLIVMLLSLPKLTKLLGAAVALHWGACAKPNPANNDVSIGDSWPLLANTCNCCNNFCCNCSCSSSDCRRGWEGGSCACAGADCFDCKNDARTSCKKSWLFSALLCLLFVLARPGCAPRPPRSCCICTGSCWTVSVELSLMLLLLPRSLWRVLSVMFVDPTCESPWLWPCAVAQAVCEEYPGAWLGAAKLLELSFDITGKPAAPPVNRASDCNSTLLICGCCCCCCCWTACCWTRGKLVRAPDSGTWFAVCRGIISDVSAPKIWYGSWVLVEEAGIWGRNSCSCWNRCGICQGNCNCTLWWEGGCGAIWEWLVNTVSSDWGWFAPTEVLEFSWKPWPLLLTLLMVVLGLFQVVLG